MAKITRGSAPSTIKHTVKGKQLDGSSVEVKLEYRYRDREAFGEYLDEYKARTEEVTDSQRDSDMSAKESQLAISKLNADFMDGIVVKWDAYDGVLDDETRLELALNFPQITQKIISDYHAACVEGRLGN